MSFNKSDAIKAAYMLMLGTAIICWLMLATACGQNGKVNAQDAQITRLLAQLNQQRDFAAELQDNIAGLNATIMALASTVQNLGTTDATVQVLVNSLQIQLLLLNSQQADNEADMHALEVRIATLEGFTSIAEVIDLCGDTAGKYDEVLLRLTNGQIIASFSDNAAGQNTRFALIPNGSYSTTDGTNCHFNVQNGAVTW